MGIKGQIPWNKGKKMSESMRQKMRGNKNATGRIFKHSEKTKEHFSLIRKGKPSSRKGVKISLSERQKMSERRIQYLKRVIPNYDVTGKSLVDDRKKVRRERIKKFGGFHSKGEWETLKTQYNSICPSCKKQEPEIKLTRDHIIPIARGGSDNIENIQPLCVSCNSKKSTRTITY